MIRIRNHHGFTLIESLLTLFVSGLVLFLVTLCLQMVMKTESYFANNQTNIEWHIFLNQAEYDFQNKKIKKVYAYEIVLEESGSLDVITYAHNGSKIRWQRNKSGYVPVLNKVKYVKFQKNATGLLLDVTFTNNQNLKGAIPIVEK